MTGSGSSAAVVKAPAVEQQRPEGEAGGAGEHAAVPDLPADLSILPVIDERLVDDAEEQKDYGADAVPPVDADGVTHTVQPQHYSAAAEGATDDVCSERWGKPGLLTKQQAAALADFKAKQTTEATMGDTEVRKAEMRVGADLFRNQLLKSYPYPAAARRQRPTAMALYHRLARRSTSAKGLPLVASLMMRAW